MRGALGGIVIALATLIAIFTFYALARAETPPTHTSSSTSATTVNNGAGSAIGPTSPPDAPSENSSSTPGSATTTY